MRRVRSQIESLDEARRRTCWPAAPTLLGDRSRVAALIVNYDTAQLTAQLVFSLMRVLEPGALTRIVIVDNSPHDDVTGVLAGLHDAGIVTVLHNRARPYHGPGLNRGLSYLSEQQRIQANVDLVWVLDSDVIALHPDALTTALDAMTRTQAVLAGQVRTPYPLHWPQGHLADVGDGTSVIWQPHWQPHTPPPGPTVGPHPVYWPYIHISSLLLDPAVLWQPALPPFQEDGEPGIAMQAAMHRQGLRAVDVPVFRDELLLHLGRGTSFAVRDARRWRNRYYRWSRYETAHHYEGNQSGPERYAAFWDAFTREVPVAEARLVVEACLRPERLAFA